MNSRPAPRPPTDRRPPLSLTPTVIGYPGNNNSTASLNSPSLRNLSGLTSTTITPTISRTNTFDNFNNVSAIRQGYIKLKEGGFGNLLWKTKWAVLRQNTLEFQKNEGGKISFQVILAHVTGLSRYDEVPLCIELIRAANPSAQPNAPMKDQPQKYLYIKFDRDDDLYEWQDNIYNRCPSISGVSNPTNFNHRVHVGFDAGTGAFLGLPKEWEKLLNNSAITKDDYRKNPQAVIEVLEFYSDIQKRNDNPQQFPSLTPTPPVQTSQNMQLGHGGMGTSIAPPRPAPPGSSQGYGAPRSASGSPASSQRNPSNPQGYGQYPQSSSSARSGPNDKINMGGDMRRMMEEEARRIKEQQAEKERRLREDAERERRDQERRELEEYNASIPQKKVPLAKQEIGGGGYGGPVSDPNRYNPTRAAPSAPGSAARQQAANTRQPGQQRPNQSPSDSASGPAPPRAPYAQQNGSSSREQSPSSRSQQRPDQGRQPGAPRQPGASDRNQSPSTRAPPNGNAQPTRLPGPAQPKPLNVNKAANEPRRPEPEAKPAPAAKAAEPRQKEARMSSMSESEVMSKLRKIVTRYDPQDSYVKQKKIGQGASGSVYIAKVRQDATSPVAKTLFRRDGTESRVAIKTMDLRHQPRKELIVNEIIVMKESVSRLVPGRNRH
jgi:hypothetical protein